MGASGSKSIELWEDVAKKLKNEEINPGDLDFWSRVWDEPESAEDIWFGQFSFKFVNELKQSNPKNFCSLLRQIVSELASVVNDPSDEPITFQEHHSCMNCIRILTRLIPVILESDSEDDAINNAVWSVQEVDGQLSSVAPLAAQIVTVLTECLFLPGLTIPKPRSQPTVINGVFHERVWATGFGVDPQIYTPASTIEYDQNRTDIIKCLITCFSTSLFIPTENFSHDSDPWLSVMVNPEHNPKAKTLFYSLINTIIHYDPSTVLPYTYALSTDSAEPLVDAALQLLLILLDFRHLPPDDVELQMDEKEEKLDPSILEQSQQEEQQQANSFVNIFRECLFFLPTNSDLEKLFTAIGRLLNIGHKANNTYLPHSMKTIGCYQELFVLLWKLLDESESFYQFVLNADVGKIVIPVLYFMYIYRQDQSRTGLIHTCTFILLKLSGEREFGIALNTPFTTKLPLRDIPAFQGTLADLLIIVTHKLIINSPQHVDSLFHVLLTVLANVSPYIMKMCLISSVKLLNLLELFSSPKYLYAAENHHQYLFFLLDVFNNIIQYQSYGNARLIYAITRRSKLFYRIGQVPNTTPSPQPQQPTSPSNEPINTAVGTSDSQTAEVKQEPTSSSSPSPDSEEAGHQMDVKESDPQEPTSTPALADVDRDTQGPHSETTKFVPNPEWIISWKRKLPLEAIYRLLEYLVPKLEALCSLDTIDEMHIVKYLEETTLVGILPFRHHIVVRRYRPSTYTALWFTTYVWGVIFLRNQLYPLFRGNAIQMFSINTVEEDAYDSDYMSDGEFPAEEEPSAGGHEESHQNPDVSAPQSSSAGQQQQSGGAASMSMASSSTSQVVSSQQSRAVPSISEHREVVVASPSPQSVPTAEQQQRSRQTQLLKNDHAISGLKDVDSDIPQPHSQSEEAIEIHQTAG